MCSSVIAHSAFTIRCLLYNVPLMIFACWVCGFELLLWNSSPFRPQLHNHVGFFFIYQWSFKVLVELSIHWFTLDVVVVVVAAAAVAVAAAAPAAAAAAAAAAATAAAAEGGGGGVVVSTFMQGIYNYMPETNHVSKVLLQLFYIDICAACNIISRVKYVLNFYICTFWSIYFLDFLLSGRLLRYCLILRWFQLPHLLLVSLQLSHCTCTEFFL